MSLRILVDWGGSYDKLAIDLDIPTGMLGGGSPTKAETSRDHSGLMVIRTEVQAQDSDGLEITRGTMDRLAARERLTLPGYFPKRL